MILRSRSGRMAAAGALVGSVALASAVALPAEANNSNSNNNNSRKLRAAVTLGGLNEHLGAFQQHADDNGGNRFAGLPGHDASAAYAAEVFRKAGYTVTTQEFSYLASAFLGPGGLEKTSPGSASYVLDTDYARMSQSDPGDVTAPVASVDLMLGAGNTSTSGCETADFAGFAAGSIALMQRGTCSFEQKVENASAAGAVAALIFNQGNSDDRKGLANVTLGAGNTSGIPALFATYDRGVEWAGTPGLEMRVFVDAVREEKTTRNVFAESKSGDPNNVVMAGAHLDSVSEGPGINDNGTGSAGILEIAKQMRKVKTTNKVRFALWSAEESGLVGANEYVASLSPEELDKIALYLNFDMIGSPNYVRFVYDGDNSAFPVGPGAAEGPAGSDVIEQVFHNYFADSSLDSAETAFSGRSDYGPFIAKGIPAGGLFTGAEGIKTEAQAAIFGGTAGVAYDACYHQACDTIDNVNSTGFHEMADAAAHTVLTFAMSTYEVNGIGEPSKREGVDAQPKGGTSGSGGGLHEDHDHEEVTH